MVINDDWQSKVTNGLLITGFTTLETIGTCLPANIQKKCGKPTRNVDHFQGKPWVSQICVYQRVPIKKQRFNLPQWLYLVGAAMGYNENTMKLFKGITWYINQQTIGIQWENMGYHQRICFSMEWKSHTYRVYYLNEGFKQQNTRIYGYCGIYIYIHIWYIYI